MSDRKVKLLITIMNYDAHLGKKVTDIANDLGNTLSFSFLGHGTARKHLLNYLGLGESQKEIMFSLISDQNEVELLKSINKELKLYLLGRGIAFTIPVASISKIIDRTITTSLQKQSSKSKGAQVMESNNKYNLIVVGVKPTHTNEVIEASRKAGATGGTIINARGVNNRQIEQFLGLNIQEEIEIVLIIALKEVSKDIMLEIQKVAGLHTEGNGILFSLPVDNLVGIGQIDDEIVEQ